MRCAHSLLVRHSRPTLTLMKVMWLIAGLLTNTAIAEPRTHCDSSEKTVFSCTILGSKKVASLCGDAGRFNEVTSLQYRFGASGRPEMVYPKVKQGSLEKFFAHFETHQEGSITDLWFMVGSYRYLLAADSARGRKVSSHIVVYKDWIPVANLECAKTLVDEVRGLGGTIPDANESGFFKQK